MALTKKDLQNIKRLVETTFDERFEKETRYNLATKNDLLKFPTRDEYDIFATKDDIKHLPTKTEFYKKMDEVMGELQKIRERQDVLSVIHIKVNDHEDRIEVIEDKLDITSPAVI